MASCSTRSTPATRTIHGAGSTRRPSPASSPGTTPETTWPPSSPGSRPSCPTGHRGPAEGLNIPLSKQPRGIRTMPAPNVLVAQSGGPTCVINNSLRGIIETCRRETETFGVVYAGHFGIEGVLKEELLALSATSDEEIALLRPSPGGGGIGPCRYKLKKGQD